MGTHSHLAVTHANGAHECVERTLDGFKLVGLMCDWVETELPDFGDLQDPQSQLEISSLFDSCGAGIMELSSKFGEPETRHERQEGEASYWCWVDFTTGARRISGDPETMWRAFADVKKELTAKGWTVDLERDPCWLT